MKQHLIGSFDPQRLTLARELRGLSKSELASFVDKTPSAVSQFESGHVRPDVQTLRRLSLALGLPLSYFYARSDARVVPLDSCHWRSLRSASQRDRRRLLAVGTMLCELAALLEEEVDLPQPQIPVFDQEVRTDADIEECAQAVRRTWGLGNGPIPNVVNRLEVHGILVLRIFDSCREVDAFSHWSGQRPCVFLVMEKDSTSRTRFDAAHELGHLIMHADVTPANPDAERQANRFAGAFLFPREPFVQEWPDWLDWSALRQLKLRWKVSYAALIRRAYDLGLLSQASYRRAYLYLSQTNQRRGEEDEPPAESPTLLPEALSVLADDLPLPLIASRLSISVGDLKGLLEGGGGLASARPITNEEASETDSQQLLFSIRRSST